jgi:3-phosphoshikimate 1-carboxyvinyltransferase
MRGLVVRPVFSLKGKISLPGDKSITHRALILSALAQGETIIENYPANEDCLSTAEALRKLGLNLKQRSKSVIEVNARGLSGLSKPGSPIFIGESGTTFRLLSGVLAGQNFVTRLIAGRSLSRRPMLRVTAPLRSMGANIVARRRGKDEYPPVTIRGRCLKAITYKMPVASAQVKGAILLAALYAKGKTKVIEPVKTRDHTERMLRLFKADIQVKKNTIIVRGGRMLASPSEIYVPGDISSAAFFMVAAAILPGSEIIIKNVSLNPSRSGVISVLKRMGVRIKVRASKPQATRGEPMGDIIIKGSRLKNATVKKEEIPSLIDELPILMVAAASGRGKTVFQGVEELRVKEADRINSMFSNLKKMGADIRVVKSGKGENIVVRGMGQLKGASVRSFGDHRTAMSMIVAGLAAIGQTKIDDISCINKSFPGFIKVLGGLTS